MSDLRKAAKDLLHEYDSGIFDDDHDLIHAVNALRAALDEPRPEPVAWMESPHGVIRANPDYRFNFPSQLLHWQIPLYTAPPAAAPEPVAKACWACNGKGCLRDIDTGGLLPCVVCKPQEDKQ